MRLGKVGDVSKLLGIHRNTVIKWHETGELKPDKISTAGTRFYDLDRVEKLFLKTQQKNRPNLTACYSRVSTHDQKNDLKRQMENLTSFCIANGWNYVSLSDIGSGLNFNRANFKKLLGQIHNKEINRLVLQTKDRLLRFGSEIIFELCLLNDIEVVIVDQSEQITFEQELAEDVIEIITVFSAKLYGKRSHKNKKILEFLEKEIT
jgi:predicted site-specific integrase-resolvase